MKMKEAMAIIDAKEKGFMVHKPKRVCKYLRGG